MDQPERCRRTDGKRWRCSKAVLPNEKYCEKHMHRGCGRSRKLVESSDIASPRLNVSKVPWNVTKSQTTKNSIGSGPKDLKIKEPEDPRGNGKGTVTTKITFKSEGKRDEMNSNGKVEEQTLKRDTKGLEFSPKSVLGEGSVSINQSSNTESVVTADESRKRCRRTDGKRWRCTKEVVAEDHKYCAKHMHRGSKKRFLATPQQGECNSFALVKRANKLVVGFDSN